MRIPGNPKEVKQVVSGLENHSFTLETPAGLTYVVSYFDVPAGMTLPLDTAVNAFVKSTKGVVVNQQA